MGTRLNFGMMKCSKIRFWWWLYDSVSILKTIKLYILTLVYKFYLNKPVKVQKTEHISFILQSIFPCYIYSFIYWMLFFFVWLVTHWFLNGKSFITIFWNVDLFFLLWFVFLKEKKETIINMAFQNLLSMWLEQSWVSIQLEYEDEQWHLLVPSVLVCDPLLGLEGWYLQVDNHSQILKIHSKIPMYTI